MVELAFVCYITRCKASSVPKDPVTPPPSTSMTGFYSSVPTSRCFKSNHSYTNGSCRSDKGSILCHDRTSRRSTVNRENSLLLRGGGGSPSPPLGVARIRTNPSPPPGNGNGGVYEMGTFISQQPLTFEQINGHQPAFPTYMKPKRRQFSFSIAPESIDKFSIVMFPLAFTIFNVSSLKFKLMLSTSRKINCNHFNLKLIQKLKTVNREPILTANSNKLSEVNHKN